MTSLARMSSHSGTTSFPTLDSSVPSRSRSSTLDSLSRSRNPSLSQSHPPIQEEPPKPSTTAATSRPAMPRRTSSAMHREVLTRLRPLPFQYIWCAWHSRASSGTASAISSAPSSNSSNASTSPTSTSGCSTSSSSQPSSPTYGLTLLSPDIRDIATFYRIFNNLPLQNLKLKESIHFFRTGVRPLWEDPSNLSGGCLVLKIRKDSSGLDSTNNNNNRALRAWEETCLLALGGELQSVMEKGDHVLGLSFSPRLYVVHISIWTQQGRNKESVGKLQEAVLRGLSEELRPRGGANGGDCYYKVHAEHDDFEQAVKAMERE